MPLLLMVFDPITADDHRVVQPSFPALAGKRLLHKTQIPGFPKFPGSKAALISSWPLGAAVFTSTVVLREAFAPDSRQDLY